MQDLRERMTQALYSAAPNIGEAVMEYVDEQQGIIDTLLDEIQARDESERDLQAHLAAMREALEAAITKPSWEFQHVAKADVMEILDTTDAGRELLERLAKAESRIADLEDDDVWENIKRADERIDELEHQLHKAEAERVEVVPTDGRSLCEMAACPHWNNGDCLVLSCGVKYVYDFLLAHNMIREAE